MKIPINENKSNIIPNQSLLYTNRYIHSNSRQKSNVSPKISSYKVRMIPIPKTKRRFNNISNMSQKLFQEENNSPNVDMNYERQRALFNFSFGKLYPSSTYSTNKELSYNKKDIFQTKTEETQKKINRNIHHIPIPITISKKSNLNKNNCIINNDINNINNDNDITTKINMERNIKLIEENFVDNFKNKERSESLKKALKMYNKIKSLGKLSSEKSNENLNNSYTSGFNYNKKFSKTIEKNNRKKYFIRKLVTEEKFIVDENGKEQLIGIKCSVINDKEHCPLKKISSDLNNQLVAYKLKKNKSQKNNKIKSIPISINNSSINSFRNKIPHDKNLKIKKIEKCSSHRNINSSRNMSLNNQIYVKKICGKSKSKENQNQTKIIKIPNQKKYPFADTKLLKRNHSYHEILSSFRTINTINTDYLNSDTDSHLTNYTNREKQRINNMKKMDTEKNSNSIFLSRCSNNSNCSYYESKSLSKNNFTNSKIKNSNSQTNIYTKELEYNNIGYHESQQNTIYKGNTINNTNIDQIKPKYFRKRNNSYSNYNYVTFNIE